MKCLNCGRYGHLFAACAVVYTSTKGQDNGGIRELEDIRGRCVIDDETGCWHWRGAVAANTTKSICPVAWSPALGKVVSVLRQVYEFAHPEASMIGRMVWRSCASQDCCNPKHLLMGTRKQWGEWITKNGKRKGDPLASARNRKARLDSGDAILNMELAQWARESTQTGRDVAHALGVSATTISRARMRRTWGETLPCASVFSMAANSWLMERRA